LLFLIVDFYFILWKSQAFCRDCYTTTRFAGLTEPCTSPLNGSLKKHVLTYL